MTKKRKSRGRSKGGKGSSGFISCSNCGAHVPRDKAKKVTTRLSMVEPLLALITFVQRTVKVSRALGRAQKPASTGPATTQS